RVGVDGNPSLFDRLFNLPTYVRVDGHLPADTVRFVHSSLRTAGTPAPADNTLHRLLAALSVGDEELAALITGLAPALGANPGATNENDRGFLLTAANLTLLYRHARLAHLLSLRINDLLGLLSFAGLTGNAVSGRADLHTLLDLRDWFVASGYTLDDLGVATG